MKTRLITAIGSLALIGLAMVTTLKSQQKEDLFSANLEALADGEGATLKLSCERISPIVYCEKMCFHCLKIWREPGEYGKVIGVTGHCVCGAELKL